MLGTADDVGPTAVVGTTEVGATDAGTDGAVFAVGIGTNTPPLVVEELNGTDGPSEGPAAFEV